MSDTVRLHRSLVRIEAVRPDGIDVMVPGWNPNEIITVVAWDAARPGMYFLALVNIGEPDKTKLRFSAWEIAPNPRDDDGLA